MNVRTFEGTQVTHPNGYSTIYNDYPKDVTSVRGTIFVRLPSDLKIIVDHLAVIPELRGLISHIGWK
jgi:hypothetical protein